MVNREAVELIEALRLQKLRAVEYLLMNIIADEEKDIAVAIEMYEDVYVRTESGELFEQDKNYDPTSKFTLNSEEVLKSICSFIDIWTYNSFSKNLSFCFLSTNEIGKENSTARTKKLSIILPDSPILKELASSESNRIEKVAAIVKDVVVDFYTENYSSEVSTIEFLSNLKIDQWIEFLKQITWLFGSPEVSVIEKSVEEKIKECSYYSTTDNAGQEDAIKAKLLEMVEKKSTKTDRVFRLVHKTDVQVSYNTVIGNNRKLDDVHKLWETIEKPSDVRNLNDKILAVCPSFDVKRLEQLNRQAAIAKVFESNYKNSSQYLALKFRIFNFCEAKLYAQTENKSKVIFTEGEIELMIKDINSECIKEFEDLKKDYTYGVERNSIILELFIEFIDSCYLAFD